MKGFLHQIIFILILAGLWVVPAYTQTARIPATLDELIALARENDTDLATAAVKLESSLASLDSQKAWRSSSLSVQGSASGTLEEEATDPKLSWNAQAALPINTWLSLGASVAPSSSGASSSDESLIGKLSLSVSPFAFSSTSAERSYRSALQSYNAALRNSRLETLSALRKLGVTEAELAYREAELEYTALKLEAAELSHDAGEMDSAELLAASAEKTAARLTVEALQSDLTAQRDEFALRLGLPLSQLPENKVLAALDSNTQAQVALMNEDSWLAQSTGYNQAILDLEAAQEEARKAVTKPELLFKGDVSTDLTGSQSESWSISASVKLPLDLVYQSQGEVANKNLELKRAILERLGYSTLEEYKRKTLELLRLEASWERTGTALESARLLFDQVELLYSLGRKSQSEYIKAQGDILKARWQTESALKNYKDARDLLSK